MLHQVLELFRIRPEYDLDILRARQTLNDVTTAVIQDLKLVLTEFRPDLVLVQGGTATTFGAALASFYQRIPLGHVETGLKTGNMSSPWAEEANRKSTSVITKSHFAPTGTS